MNPRSHIFISYARLDGEEVARTIHQRLESEHLTCWRDRLDLTGGEEFWTQLETGIAGARWVLIVLTPAALQSEWTAKEWREARKRGIPICPVWTSNATALGEMLAQNPLPAGMQRGHIYTPFAEPETSPRSDEEWRNVVATLRQEKDVRYAPFMAPPLPAGYVERPIEVEAVTTQLLGERRGQAVAATALRGVGGMGKTTLAQAVAHRDDVVDAFYDGVLWATVGIQPKLVEVITDLCLALGPKQTFAGLNAAESHLRGMLRDRRCLVILDDVWRTTDVTPLLGLGPLVTTLVTTRVADVARAVGRTKGIVLDQMTPDQATDMLMSALGDNPTSPKTHRSPIVLRCRTLAERLGRWPFVLALAAAQVRLQLDFGEGPEGALEWIAGRMDREGVASLDADARPEDFDDSRKRDRAFATSIGGSLSLLGERERRAFFDLGIFPEDVEIPLATAAQLWSVPDAKPIALKLANLALVDLRLGDRPVIRLHDLILTFIAQRLRDENRWSDTHRRLLDAWKDPAAPPNPFGWRWVCRHLKEAGEEARLIEMLFEYDLVSKRLVAEGVGIDRLVSDYGLLDHVVEAAHVGQALARAAHIIAPRPDLLSQQLLGRVTITTPLAMRLLSGTRGRAPRHALLPRTPSLASRGSVMRQLAHHEGGVSRLALTEDGRVVTGGGDSRVLCARLDGGEPVPLAQHEGGVFQLALTGDGRVVTGGRDGRVFCARLEGGDPVPLAQHEGWVSHLALTEDGRVVTGGEDGRDGRVLCARLEGGEAVPLAQHKGGVSQLALTGDGRVVTGGRDGRLMCARLEGGEAVPLAQHEGGVSQLALTGDGRVVTGGLDGRVLCARLEGGEVVRLAQHEGAVSQLALTRDGRVVTGGTDGRVLCARLEGGEVVPLAQHEGGVFELALTGDGRVVTGGTDGRVLCARLEGGEAVPLAEHEGAVLQLALTGDGRVVTGGTDGRVLCARLEGGEAVPLARHEGGVLQLALTGDGRVVTGGSDGRVLCARLEGGEAVLLAQHERGVFQLALTGDGRVVTGGRDGRVLCARLEGGAAVPVAQHEGGISQLALTGDGRVVTGGRDGRVLCARLEGGVAVPLAQHEGAVSQLALTGDGRVVTGGMDGHVLCARLEGGAAVPLAQHEAGVSQLALTRDSRVVTGGRDGRVLCARLEGGEAVPLAQHEGRVYHLALTGDGRVVTGGEDGRVLCACLEGGEPVPVAQHEGGVFELALTGDGRVVSGGMDGCVLCTRLEGAEPVPLAQHGAGVYRLALTGDGRVVTGGSDGRVLCAPLEGGEAVLLVHHEAGVYRLALTGDGRVVTGGRDGRVLCARLEGGAAVPLAQHEGAVSSLMLTGEGRVITSGAAAVFVTQLEPGHTQRVFLSDLSLIPIAYDSADSLIVGGDAAGNLHILPIG